MRWLIRGWLMNSAPDFSSDNSEVLLHRRSPGIRVLSDTFKSRGAMFGAGWLALLALAAVFAPLLANSRPLLNSVNGMISSPAFVYLTPLDFTLLVMFLAAVILFFLPLSFRKKVLLFGVAFTATWLLAVEFINPPKLSVYETHRELKLSLIHI